MTTTLIDRLGEIVGAAFAHEGLDAGYGTVRPSDRPDLCQFQCNGALAAAKAAKRNPREIAQAVADRLGADRVFASVELAGPGFLNLTLTDAALAEAAANADGWTTDAPEKIVVDYGGPNIAKPLAAHHLRAALIGEAIKRTLRAVGHEAVGDIHLGDWGLQMGQLITELERTRPDLPYWADEDRSPYPAESPVTVQDLALLYPQASAACKADSERMKGAQAATAALQAGRPGYRAAWQHFVDVSVGALRGEYDELDVGFELWRGEASAHPFVEPLVEQLGEQGLLEDSDGARVVRVARDGDKKELPPLMVVKSNGSVGYGSTDLATIYERVQEGFERCVYVVDKRQAEHFEQVFRAADAMGLMAQDRLEHAGFGTMNGKDGRPFKTRDGTILRLRDLIDQVTALARERVAERGRDDEDGDSVGDGDGASVGMASEEREEVARLVGMAALKFADLSNPRTTDYVFDLDRFVAFEGKTGPYLLYAAVRIASVIDKAGYTGGADAFAVSEPAERDLALVLAAYPDAVRTAATKRMPHVLCEHAYDLASAFSRFYAACRIGDEADEAVRASRLALSAATSAQLRTALDLLGIEVPARM